MTRRSTLLAAAVSILATACASGPPFIDQMQPQAIDMAVRRGQFEMNCPTATGELINRETIQPASRRLSIRARYVPSTPSALPDAADVSSTWWSVPTTDPTIASRAPHGPSSSDLGSFALRTIDSPRAPGRHCELLVCELRNIGTRCAVESRLVRLLVYHGSKLPAVWGACVARSPSLRRPLDFHGLSGASLQLYAVRMSVGR
jgi:hypothetical protein